MLADERSAVEDSAAALDADTAAAVLSSAAAAAECVLEHPASHITEQSSHFKVGDTYSLKTKMKLSVQSHYL